MARESQIVNAWKREGARESELRTQRRHLLKLVKAQLQDPVPEAVRLAVDWTTDPATLERWYDAALTADSIADLRKTMKLDP